jgi:hypothetical protein
LGERRSTPLLAADKWVTISCDNQKTALWSRLSLEVWRQELCGIMAQTP